MRVNLLDDSPINEDKLGIHQRVADLLCEVIEKITKDNEEKKNAIGLFGTWGSGKSTVINLLKQKRGNRIFIFDSWSYKDEFIKRAFLLGLARYLEVNMQNIETRTGDKIPLEDYLTKRVVDRRIVSRSDPKVTFPLFLVLLVIILSLLGYNLAEILKTNIYLYWIICGVISIGFGCIYWKKRNWLSQIFTPFISGTLNVRDTQLTVESLDFSNMDFQWLLKEIIKKANSNNSEKEIIVVLDNLDRVDNETVLKFISLIQAALESLKSDDHKDKLSEKLVFIVPIDKERLLQILSSVANPVKNLEDGDNFAEDFIEKIFPYSVQIPEIVPSNWKEFFKEKFKEAFPDLEVDPFELEMIIRVFKAGIDTSGEKLTPREIIHFINQMVLNYLYWQLLNSKHKTKEQDIKLIHRAIFVALVRYEPEILIEHDIVKKENSKILNSISTYIGSYINESKLQEDLLKQKYKSNAVWEILYLEDIEESLRNGDKRKFEARLIEHLSELI